MKNIRNYPGALTEPYRTGLYNSEIHQQEKVSSICTCFEDLKAMIKTYGPNATQGYLWAIKK
jgi:hypothetical protein